GSSANLLTLSVLTNPLLEDRIMPRTEVITPAVTWATTVYPIANVGCTPVLVDVDPETMNIDPEQVKQAIGPQTSAIMPVHLLGCPCHVDELVKLASDCNLYLLEDSCESTGAEYKGRKVGTFGDMGTFSFFMSHHISTIEGGMIVTDDDEFYEYLKAMRAFGWIRDMKEGPTHASENIGIDPRFLFITYGYNFRPTELQGGFGIHQIGKLDGFIKIRRDNAEYWNRRLAGFKDVLMTPTEPSGTKHVYFGYPLTVRPEAPFKREVLVAGLESAGIETRPIMAGNMAEQPVMKQLPYRVIGDLPNSRMIMRNSFFFGNHQGIQNEEREYIADTIETLLATLTKA
ncbi:MAG TPA: DegT/DnrJ/EryC1/StrS family aminotransferase, partial [Candidatus Binatus sp.]|nr:DegT/DnrJ/EryC1/StrS family aminotransferase [Candidatus Binatus sp.]